MISLFTTFFLTPDDSERQEELLFCLNANINNQLIKSIYIFLDGKYTEEIKELINKTINTDKIKYLNIGKIPSYGDWINYSKYFLDKLEEITVFANADIYTDTDLAKLQDFLKPPETIVCLSRHNVQRGEIIPHPNPQWSQDLWAISKKNITAIDNLVFVNELSAYSTGAYRCDNKLAYLFAMRGWVIYNPFPIIKCFHLQKSNSRKYGKFDLDVVGGLCFPSPTEDPAKPSDLDISVMPAKVGNITKCAINKFLHKNLWQ